MAAVASEDAADELAGGYDPAVVAALAQQMPANPAPHASAKSLQAVAGRRLRAHALSRGSRAPRRSAPL